MRLSYLPGIPAPPMEKSAAEAPVEEYKKFLKQPTDVRSPIESGGVKAVPSWVGTLLGAGVGGVGSYDILKELSERAALTPLRGIKHKWWEKVLDYLFHAGAHKSQRGIYREIPLKSVWKRIPKRLSPVLQDIARTKNYPRLATAASKLPGLGHWAVASPLIAGALIGRWLTKD